MIQGRMFEDDVEDDVEDVIFVKKLSTDEQSRIVHFEGGNQFLYLLFNETTQFIFISAHQLFLVLSRRKTMLV